MADQTVTETETTEPNDEYSRMVASASKAAGKYEKQRDALYFDQERLNPRTVEKYSVRMPLYADPKVQAEKLAEIDQAVEAELGETLAVLDSEEKALASEIERLQAWDYWATLPVSEIEKANSLTPMVREDIAGDPRVLLARLKAAHASGDVLRLQLYMRYIEQHSRQERKGIDKDVLKFIQAIEKPGNPNAKKIEALTAKHKRVYDTLRKVAHIKRDADGSGKRAFKVQF